jgi:hypothetical protein
VLHRLCSDDSSERNVREASDVNHGLAMPTREEDYGSAKSFPAIAPLKRSLSAQIGVLAPIMEVAKEKAPQATVWKIGAPWPSRSLHRCACAQQDHRTSDRVHRAEAAPALARAHNRPNMYGPLCRLMALALEHRRSSLTAKHSGQHIVPNIIASSKG